MHVDLTQIKQELDLDEVHIKEEPSEWLTDDQVDDKSLAEHSLNIIEETPRMVIISAVDGQSLEERNFIRNAQQLLTASSLECHVCHYSLSSVMELSTHLANHQLNRHFCRHMCGIWMESLNMIVEHEHRHAPPGMALCCQICDFVAENSDNLITHMQKHLYVYRFVCAICRRHFESVQDVRLHRKISKFACAQVECSEYRPELVPINGSVPADTSDVDIKKEPLDEPVIVKTENEEPSEVASNVSTRSNLATSLKGKLRLPAIKTKTSVAGPGPSPEKQKQTETVQPPSEKAADQNVKVQANPVAGNILQVLPTNCMLINLPPHIKLVPIAAAPPPETRTLPNSITIKKVKPPVKDPPQFRVLLPKQPPEFRVVLPTAPPEYRMVLPTSCQESADRRPIDSFKNTNSSPESAKIITEIRNQILSIEKTLPIPGSVLQGKKGQSPGPPDNLTIEALQPFELILNPLAISVMKDLRAKNKSYGFQWVCPKCQRAYEQCYAFRMHLINKHAMSAEVLNNLKVTIRPYNCESSTFTLYNLFHINLCILLIAVSVTDESSNQPMPSKNPLEFNSQKPNTPESRNKAAKETTPKADKVELMDVDTPTRCQTKLAKTKKTKEDEIYQCTVCSKVFTTSGALRIHKSIHTGELPHKCDYCDKRFRTPGQVRVHHRRHTGEKPFKCKVGNSMV
ncbi:hypothetical protein KR018_002334 [Drosophila ironensis]|nr:hypothetical protein KR018_002334 [Drosophila ironensis]